MLDVTRRIGTGWRAVGFVAATAILGCTADVSAHSIGRATAPAVRVLDGSHDSAARAAFEASASAVTSEAPAAPFVCGVMDMSESDAGDDPED